MFFKYIVHRNKLVNCSDDSLYKKKCEYKWKHQRKHIPIYTG